jgi:S-formylglutathione hydrolase FrmB
MRTVPINVVIPTDKMLFPGMPVPEKKPFKTLYLLHGVFGNYTDWVNGTRLQALANDHNICVVMPSGDNKFYCDSATSGDNYGKFIGEELVEFVRDTFNVSKEREDTFIGGLSMGGFGSFVNGLRHPETFSCICALSAALIKSQILNSVNEPGHDIFTKRNYETMFGIADTADWVGSENDYEALAVKLKDSPIKPKIYMACGTEDGLIAADRAYRDLLIENGYDVTWEEGPGVHNWAFWDTYIEHVLDWLPLGAAVKGVSSENVGK